jgi:cell division protein FtsB
MNESERSSSSIVKWRYAIIGAILVIVIFGVGAIRESYRGWRSDTEIRALEAQANDLEGRNARLRDLASALQSPDRLDVEARKRLGMRQPGERVVVLDGFSASGTWEDLMKMDVVQDKPQVVYTNAELWLRYFIHPKG